MTSRSTSEQREAEKYLCSQLRTLDIAARSGKLPSSFMRQLSERLTPILSPVQRILTAVDGKDASVA